MPRALEEIMRLSFGDEGVDNDRDSLPGTKCPHDVGGGCRMEYSSDVTLRKVADRVSMSTAGWFCPGSGESLALDGYDVLVVDEHCPKQPGRHILRDLHR